MTSRFIAALILLAAARAEIVDRIAIVVNKRIVKDSDIDLDLRVTAFLNNQPLAATPAARKDSAQRLVDQVFIREEITSGDYESAPVAEAQNLLASIKKSRFSNDIAYREALKKYGVSEDDLKEKLFWQMTVLHFIDLRFKPSVLVTDDEIKSYYDEHRAQLQAAHGGQPATLETLHDSIEETITGERVNKLLFDWLARRRKAAKIIYHEPELQGGGVQ